MSTNGNGHGDAKSLGLRPALEDVMVRQERVLAQLEGPIPRAKLLHWKSEVVRAGVGRISDGLRALLADHDMAPLLDRYFTDEYPDKDVADTFRRLLHQALSMEYARALQEMSMISLEELKRQGVASAEMPRSYGTTQFR